MIFFRKRLFFWLLRAYIKRWGKSIFFFFLIGLSLFFLMLRYGNVLVGRVPLWEKESIGMVGAYTLETLPANVLAHISRGLTIVSPDGRVHPDVASSWTVHDEGKTYTFTIRPDVSYADGQKVTSATISFTFAEVIIEKPKPYTIVFRLKDPYSPFLATLSHPILKKGFVGVGDYKIRSLELNGNFVASLLLAHRNNPYRTKFYHFYPSEEALKIAFAMGEVTTAIGLSDTQFKHTTFAAFSNTTVERNVRFTHLATLFFNTKHEKFSDVKLRSALTYALPDSFPYGQRSYAPFSPLSWVLDGEEVNRSQDVKRAETLLRESQGATPAVTLTIKLTTLSKYTDVANDIAKEWEEIGVTTNIEVVETLPTDFQVLLADFRVPKDPDQYTLWHKDQENNISRYANLRIDKLLEDGRKTQDLTKRKRIYTDFQKYLLADAPAAFLFFPYEYSITRK